MMVYLLVPVSYTHLDVYKRQSESLFQFLKSSDKFIEIVDFFSSVVAKDMLFNSKNIVIISIIGIRFTIFFITAFSPYLYNNI